MIAVLAAVLAAAQDAASEAAGTWFDTGAEIGRVAGWFVIMAAAVGVVLRFMGGTRERFVGWVGRRLGLKVPSDDLALATTGETVMLEECKEIVEKVAARAEETHGRIDDLHECFDKKFTASNDLLKTMQTDLDAHDRRVTHLADEVKRTGKGVDRIIDHLLDRT